MADTPPPILKNYVTMHIGSARATVRLEGQFVMSAGLKPNLASAVVGFRDYDALVAAAGTVPALSGSLEFWQQAPKLNDQNQFVADVTIEGISVIGIEGTKFGHTTGAANDFRCTEYRFHLADWRIGYQSPKGGRLKWGLLNPSPKTLAARKETGAAPPTGATSSGTSPGDNPPPELKIRPNSELIKICLTAMGLTLNIPASVDEVPPPRDLKWFGSHAPTELDKLLARTGHVFCPHFDRSASILPVGFGFDPTIPAEAKIPDVSILNIEGRGKTVVFTSYPNPIIETVTLVGPDDFGTWEFCVQDDEKQWVALYHASDLLSGKYAPDVIRGKYAALDPKRADRIRTQLYYCIRLSPYSFNPDQQPILRQYFQSGLKPADIVVNAKIAVYDQTLGVWKNSDDFVQVEVLQIVQGNVLVLGSRLGQIFTGVSPTEPDADFVPLFNGDLSVTFSREVSKKDKDGEMKPKFLEIGFTAGTGGAVTKLSDDETQNALDDADTVVIAREDLQQLRIDDAEDNLAELTTTATALATKYLANSGQPIRIIMARGYVPGRIDGRVAEIRYDEQKRLTEFRLNTWWSPTAELYRPSEEAEAMRAESHPMEAQTAASKTAMGAAGHTQPVVPVSTARAQPAAPLIVKVHLKGNAGGRGMYTGQIVTGTSTAAVETALTEPEGQKDAGGEDIIIGNLREAKDVILDSGPDHTLPVGWYLGKIVGGGSNGTIVNIDSDRCGSTDTKSFVHADVTQVAPFSDSDEHVGRKMVRLSVLTRVVYSATDDAFYAYFRSLGFECGRLTAVTGEFKSQVFTTGDCTT
jgi:hypothetical protein